MAKTVTGRSSGPLDVKRTQEARTRHALGRKILNGVFNGGASDKEIAEAFATRRQTQGKGPRVEMPTINTPIGAVSPTRRTWTRSGLRKAGKAQRKARRTTQAVARARR